MKFEVVHTWAEYNLMKTLEHSIPLIVTASYIFAGPLGMPEPNCFMWDQPSIILWSKYCSTSL